MCLPVTSNAWEKLIGLDGLFVMAPHDDKIAADKQTNVVPI
jgi:hypothetical protein